MGSQVQVGILAAGHILGCWLVAIRKAAVVVQGQRVAYAADIAAVGHQVRSTAFENAAALPPHALVRLLEETR